MLTLCPGREAGVVVVFGLTPDRNSAAEFPIHRGFRWIADCFSIAGAEAMNADLVIKSNVEFFNSRTWAGGTWRRRTISAFGNNVEPVMSSNSVQGYPTEIELPETHCPTTCLSRGPS